MLPGTINAAQYFGTRVDFGSGTLQAGVDLNTHGANVFHLVAALNTDVQLWCEADLDVTNALYAKQMFACELRVLMISTCH